VYITTSLLLKQLVCLISWRHNLYQKAFAKPERFA